MHIYAYARVEIVYVCMDMPTGCIYMQRYKYETHVYAGLTMAVVRWRWRDGSGEMAVASIYISRVSVAMFLTCLRRVEAEPTKDKGS